MYLSGNNIPIKIIDRLLYIEMQIPTQEQIILFPWVIMTRADVWHTTKYDDSLSFRKHLERLSNLTTYQSFDNERYWINNKRDWIQCKDDPPREYPFIYLDCSKEKPAPWHHWENRTDPLGKNSPGESHVVHQYDGGNAVKDVMAYNDILHIDHMEDKLDEMERNQFNTLKDLCCKNWSYAPVWSNVLKPIFHHTSLHHTRDIIWMDNDVTYISWIIPIMLPYMDLTNQMTLIPIMMSYSDKSSLPLLLRNHWIIRCHVFHDIGKDLENIKKSESVHNNFIEHHIPNHETSSQANMTTSSQAKKAHLFWISIVQLLIITLMSYNWCNVQHVRSTAILLLHYTFLIDHCITMGRCSILTPKICSRSMRSDKIYKENKIIVGMNKDEVFEGKSCWNELAISFVIIW